MAKLTIYHNSRCSKTRQTLALIRESPSEPRIILYLTHNFSLREVREILAKLKTTTRELLRSFEPKYSKHHLSDTKYKNNCIIDNITKFPNLLERTIVIDSYSAILGRSPENVFQILEQ